MAINISDKPEINVVNVGDEISNDQIAAIQTSNSPSSGNPFATIADISDNIQTSDDSTPALLATYGTLTGVGTEYLRTVSAYGSGSGSITSLEVKQQTWTDGVMTDENVSILTDAGMAIAYGSLTNVVYQQGYNRIELSGSNIGFDKGIYVSTATSPVGLSEAGVQFSDGSLQSTAAAFVVTTGTVLTGGTADLSSGDYPDEVTIVIDGVTYAMPARAISF